MWLVPLSLVRTWFVPLSMCDRSQVVYFHPNTGGGILFLGFYSSKQTKQTNKQIVEPERERRRRLASNYEKPSIPTAGF